jgi:uncharacterized membrane protein
VKFQIKTKFEKSSKITKLATVSTETRWSAKVTRYSYLEDVTWTIYAGQLVMKSGKAFFFKDALYEATTMLESCMNDPLFKYLGENK